MKWGRETIALVATIIAVSCAIGIAIYALMPDGQSSDAEVAEEDFVGCWYLVQTLCNDSEEAVTELYVGNGNDTDLAKGSLIIYAVENGLIYATCGNNTVTGYVYGNQIDMYIETHGTYCLYTGYIQDGFLILSSAHTDFDDQGNTKKQCAGYEIRTKDPSRPLMDLSKFCPDVSGGWKVSSSVNWRAVGVNETSIKTMDISFSDRGILAGRMTVQAGSVNSSFAVKACLIPCEGGYRGLMTETNYGSQWSVTYMNGIIKIANTSKADIFGGMRSAEICFTRDGTEKGSSAISENLQNTPWIVTSSETIDSRGNVTNEGTVFIVNFEERNGNMLYAKSIYGTQDLEAYFYLTFDNGKMIKLQSCWSTNPDYVSLNVGWAEEDKICFIECRKNTDGSPITIRTILERYNPDQTDVVGHWYACYLMGYGPDGKYTELSLETSPQLSKYDIDVLTYKDDLMFGKFENRNFTAAYTNGFISMDVADIYSQVRTIRGWLENDIMILIAGHTYTYEDGTHGFASYYMALSKTRGVVALNVPSMDISGSWTSSSYVKYTVDGNADNQGSAELNVTEVRRNAFTGKLGSADVRGILLDSIGAEAVGIMTDSMGRQWYFSGNNLALNVNRVSSALYGDDDFGSIQIQLIRGIGSPSTMQYLAGSTYELPALKFVDDTGERHLADGLNKISITGQYGSCIIGKWEDTERTYDFVGSALWFGKTLVIRISLQDGQNDVGYPLGYLTFLGESNMATISIFEDVISTGCAPLVEVTS